MSQQRKKRLLFHLKTCIWYLCSGLCSVRFPVEEIEPDQDEEDIEDFVALSIKSLEGFAILDGGATKTVSGVTSVQPVADRYEGTMIETADVGFTFADGERRHQARESVHHTLTSRGECCVERVNIVSHRIGCVT